MFEGGETEGGGGAAGVLGGGADGEEGEDGGGLVGVLSGVGRDWRDERVGD